MFLKISVCTHPSNFSVEAGHVGAAGVASTEVGLAVVAAHRPKLVRQALAAFARWQKVARDAVEAGEVVHGTANGHEHTHADRIDNGGKGDPGGHPARVRLDAQDEDAADDDAEAHH
jgi:predicted transcriptional regulator